MRISLAVLFVLHGLTHVVGFSVPWRLIDADDVPYGTTLLAGHLDVGLNGVILLLLLAGPHLGWLEV